MTLLIKGMEMPMVCDDCWALDEYGDYPRCRITEEQRGYNFRIREQRMEHCPLIEVPMPHGRLIDADELRADVIKRTSLPDMPMDDITFDNCFPYWQFSEAITEAPTVIEAEGPKE